LVLDGFGYAMFEILYKDPRFKQLPTKIEKTCPPNDIKKVHI
jgi:hypothetical protein